VAQLFSLGVRATRLDFMKYIALPSGIIINLNQVAYVSAPGVYGDQEPEKAVLVVHFAAAFAGKFGGGALGVALSGDDITAFLAEMTALGLKTDATKASITIKKN